MTILYKRKYELIIGQLNSGIGKSITGLRINFDIEMDDNKETNTANINIYNLSQENIGLLEQKNVSIILKVGYGDEDLNILFIGDVVQYEFAFKDIDIITKITLKDGFIPLTQTKLSLSFSENSNTNQIIDKIISALRLTKGNYSTLPNYVYKQGFSFSGAPGAALDIVLKRIGYEWTITNHVLQITKHNKTNNQVIAQYISPETGMINQPQRFKETNVNIKYGDNKLMDGWRIECLILPSIQPKSLIKINSSETSGTFLVKSVKFTGDTEGSDWTCAVEAIQQ